MLPFYIIDTFLDVVFEYVSYFSSWKNTTSISNTQQCTADNNINEDIVKTAKEIQMLVAASTQCLSCFCSLCHSTRHLAHLDLIPDAAVAGNTDST